MSRVKVISPEETENLCTNPSAETGTTGWASSGLATFERSSTWQHRGAWSVRGVANSTTDKIQAPTVAVTNGLDYTATARVHVVSGTWKAVFDTGEVTGLTAGDYDVEIPIVAGATTPIRLELEATALDAGSAEAFVDAVQYEQKDHATTYVDGDQDDGTWTATRHASTSSRPASARSGGTIVDLGDDLDFKYVDLAGVGLPRLDHVTEELGSRDGAILQRVKAETAILTFVGTLRGGGSLPGLHAKRRALSEVLLPKPLRGFPPIRMLYSGSGDEYQIDAHYLAGLEGSIRKPSTFEKISLQFAAYDPRWLAAADVGASLAVSSSISANRIVRRIDGLWGAMSTGADGDINAILVATDKKVYVTGTFANIGGVAATRIAYWDPADDAWHAMGTGLNAEGFTLAEGPDGAIYAGGDFTLAGGVANTVRVAKWSGGAWSALSTGMNDFVLVLRWGYDGKLYAGGFFTTAGGSSRLGIARWTGSTWEAINAVDFRSGASTGVFDIAFAANGDIYAVGNFETSSGADFNRIAKHDGSAWSQVANPLGGGGLFPADADWGPDGFLYLAGSFLTFLNKWNGQQFTALGSGVNNTVNDFDWDAHGDLYLGGSFTAAGSLSLSDRVAKWNGSAFVPLPIDLPGSSSVAAVFADGDDLYIGGDFSGTATAAAATTVSNPGSADAFPVIRVIGPCTLRSIENLTTEQEIVFDSLPVAASETVTIDLRPGRKTAISTLRGNVVSQILAGSDMAAFALEPGDNRIAVLASGGSADLFFRPRHWGAE